ncbi:MAG: hypothetical protein WB821_03085, partial [Burkholderiaceae bacterium]
YSIGLGVDFSSKHAPRLLLFIIYGADRTSGTRRARTLREKREKENQKLDITIHLLWLKLI